MLSTLHYELSYYYSKLHVFKGFTKSSELEEYLKVHTSNSSPVIFKFQSGTHGLLKNLVNIPREMGRENVLFVESKKSQLSRLYMNTLCMISQRLTFYKHLKSISDEDS